MPSPFPGMDPYLEGYLWPDVHSALVHKIRQQLAPQIQPRYVARIAISVVEDIHPDAEIGIMYPGVEVIHVNAGRSASPATAGDVVDMKAGVPLTAPLTIPGRGKSWQYGTQYGYEFSPKTWEHTYGADVWYKGDYRGIFYAPRKRWPL